MTSGVMKSFCKRLGIVQRFSTAFHHSSNGTIERMNRTLLNTLQAYVKSDQSDWDLLIPSALFAQRTSRHDTTLFSPSEVVQGRQLRLPIDVQLRLPGDVDNMSEDSLFQRMSEIRQKIRGNVEKKQQNQKVHYDKNKR